MHEKSIAVPKDLFSNGIHTGLKKASAVLEKEKDEEAILEMASGGFESTVRLAKSNPAMWVPILMQNKENVLDVLNEHIVQLRKIKSCF